MTAERPPPVASDVPTQVFSRFVDALTAEGVPPDVVNRLRVVLLVEKSFTDRALRAALLGEDLKP